jgi:plastocyanin
MAHVKCLGLACIMLALVGWVISGSLPPAAAEGPGGTEAQVAVQLFQFRPNPMEVGVGTRVTWTNSDDINHTVTSGTPERRDGRFDGRLSGKGTNFSFDFTQPGAFPYYCARHQSMRGEIVVK